MRVVNCAQGSAEWFEAKCGNVSSSRIAAVDSYLTRKSKNGGPGDESGARKTLKMQIVVERLTGRHTDHYVSAPMERGVEMEPIARAEYEMYTNADVRLVGYVLHPTIEWAGCSPDGIAGKDGLIEIKCPNSTTHLDYLIAGVVPELYRKQMMWQMACTGREWCDFVSYDDRLPLKYQLFIERMTRDEAEILRMESEVVKFLAEVDAMIAKLPRQAGETSLERQLLDSMELSQQDVETVFPQ